MEDLVYPKQMNLSSVFSSVSPFHLISGGKSVP